MDLEGKHIVITGGFGGLGQAVIKAFSQRGAICHLPILEHEDMVPAGDHYVVTSTVDLTDERVVTDYYDQLPELWGSVHLVGGFSMAPVEKTTLSAFRHLVDLNVVTSFLCCREAIRVMRRGDGGGRIVNIAARPAVRPTGGMVAYSASKAAVASMTQSLAQEVVEDDICVNAILPSIIDTPMNRQVMPAADHDTWPKPAQIAKTIVTLVSPDNELISGALVPVYGQC